MSFFSSGQEKFHVTNQQRKSNTSPLLRSVLEPLGDAARRSECWLGLPTAPSPPLASATPIQATYTRSRLLLSRHQNLGGDARIHRSFFVTLSSSAPESWDAPAAGYPQHACCRLPRQLTTSGCACVRKDSQTSRHSSTHKTEEGSVYELVLLLLTMSPTSSHAIVVVDDGEKDNRMHYDLHADHIQTVPRSVAPG